MRRESQHEHPVEAVLHETQPVTMLPAPSPDGPISPDGLVVPISEARINAAPIGDPAPTDANDRAISSPDRISTCTTAQLRRFIKSRAYIPMHEIRRRFLIATEDDDVAGIHLQSGRIYVGLPGREGAMLGELLRSGEVGYELQRDPPAPVVVGVYPMRPVTRP